MAFEILLEVFSWLPAKAIFKLTAVCKEANLLVSDDFFIEKQYRHCGDHDDSGSFFLQPNSCQRYPTDNVELHSPLRANNEVSSTVSLRRGSLELLKNAGRVLASSNGLLCCRNLSENSKERLFLCNPATQTWLPIPSPSGLDDQNTKDMDINVAFDCSYNDNYMLMMLLPDHREWASNFQLKVYLPEQGVWKEDYELVKFGDRNMNLEDMPVYHNGAVHYVSDCGDYLAKGSPFHWPYVACLSINDGSVKFLSVPKSSRKGLKDMDCKIRIFKWRSSSSAASSGSSIPQESICLVKLARRRCCVWVLDDYHSGSWTRVLKMRLKAMGFIEDSPTVSGFTVLNGHSLLLATDDRIYGYHLASDQKNKGKAELISSHGCGFGRNVLFHPYSSTLRPCGRGAVPIFTL